jgi:hypothetical protein
MGVFCSAGGPAWQPSPRALFAGVKREKHEDLVAVVLGTEPKRFRPTPDLLPPARRVERLQPLATSHLDVQLLETEVVSGDPCDLRHERPAHSRSSCRERRLHPQNPSPVGR